MAMQGAAAAALAVLGGAALLRWAAAPFRKRASGPPPRPGPAQPQGDSPPLQPPGEPGGGTATPAPPERPPGDLRRYGPQAGDQPRAPAGGSPTQAVRWAPAPAGAAACYVMSPLERRWAGGIPYWQWYLTDRRSRRVSGPLWCRRSFSGLQSGSARRRRAPVRPRCFWPDGCREVQRDERKLCRVVRAAARLPLETAQASPPPNATAVLFSRVRRAAGEPWGWIEPLTSFLRDPRDFCLGDHTDSRAYLTFADASVARGRRVAFFDAGAGYRYLSAFRKPGAPSTNWFVDRYESRGIEVASVHAWEPGYDRTQESWTAGVPAGRKWTVRFSGAPVTCCGTGGPGDLVGRLREARRGGGAYVALKLDTDSPVLEESIVAALLAEPTLVDELFWEHHVRYSPMVRYWWTGITATTERSVFSNLTLADSYALFVALRRRGIRAHSWI